MSNECAFCPVEKKTEWHDETDRAILMEKLGGGPMVVLKRHTDNPTVEEVEHCRELAETYFNEEVQLKVLMNVVRNHWHAHVVRGQDLTDE